MPCFSAIMSTVSAEEPSHFLPDLEKYTVHVAARNCRRADRETFLQNLFVVNPERRQDLLHRGHEAGRPAKEECLMTDRPQVLFDQRTTDVAARAAPLQTRSARDNQAAESWKPFL